ncbi:hypothetical protein RJ639_024455 [Escallonia herrerae]|uniref:Cyanobacterial aminoacyl-tRNA synthetase CAAD domain-containing protein n=1 Tax=Escallonia herrerae TaxID=1293975 RepID=A0AA88V185_9ASTE|nr:hypothetical protein RJ639_024455 [Escallonia herrerae]
MELCFTARPISSLHNHLPLSTSQTHLRWKPYLLPPKRFSTNTGLLCYNSSSSKATTEETSTGANQYVNIEPDGVVTMEEVRETEENEYGQTEVAKDDSSVDDQMQPFELLDKLNLELDSDNSFSLLLFGGGALTGLWLATAVVGAIDSIPVFPKLMEVVGLSYTLWFGTRYLLFKKNRDELAAKIEEIKQQVLGSDDD